MIILKEIKCTYEVYEKYCKAFQEMKDKAGSYTPTENEIYQRIYPELEKYILFLLWIEMTGYDTEENKKNRQIICTILKERFSIRELLKSIIIQEPHWILEKLSITASK